MLELRIRTWWLYAVKSSAAMKTNYADILMTEVAVAERRSAVRVGGAVVAYASSSICIIFITKHIVQVLDFPFSALVLCSQVRSDVLLLVFIIIACHTVTRPCSR